MKSQPLALKRYSRRAFLQSALLGGAGLALASCSARRTNHIQIITTTTDPPPTPYPQGPHAIVRDVIDFALTSDKWPGDFGWVTFRLHEGVHAGQPVYYIRTDSSDEGFARESGLVWMPLLFAGSDGEFENKLYKFADGRKPVIRSIPGQPDFLSLFEIVNVSGGERLDLTSAEAVLDAAATGEISLDPSGIFVNYPIVKWPGGELPVDHTLDSYLGTGQLLEPVDTEAQTVKFKLHEGYPGSRYILTDTSAVDRADAMYIAPSNASWSTVEYYATDEVFVFANGIHGSGVMGYQPAVFGSSVDSLVSSPFWDHFTVRWVDEDQARILRDADEVYAAIERGELEKFNGLPDTHPNGFVVNCPIPVLADNNIV
jgi:hypothetical protein